MPDDKPAATPEIDAADAARKIEEAGIADESAAYTDAIGDAAKRPDAHPS